MGAVIGSHEAIDGCADPAATGGNDFIYQATAQSAGTVVHKAAFRVGTVDKSIRAKTQPAGRRQPTTALVDDGLVPDACDRVASIGRRPKVVNHARRAVESAVRPEDGTRVRSSAIGAVKLIERGQHPATPHMRHLEDRAASRRTIFA